MNFELLSKHWAVAKKIQGTIENVNHRVWEDNEQESKLKYAISRGCSIYRHKEKYRDKDQRLFENCIIHLKKVRVYANRINWIGNLSKRCKNDSQIHEQNLNNFKMTMQKIQFNFTT